MSYQVSIERSALKSIAKLDGRMREKVMHAIQQLAQEPRPPGCVKLTNREAWRIRVGTYRIVYRINDRFLEVIVVDVGHRRDIYR